MKKEKVTLIDSSVYLYSWSFIILGFGVFVSASFLDIKLNKKNISILITYTIITFLIQFLFYLRFDLITVGILYPVITHFTSLILYITVFRCRVIPSCMAIISAYLCCKISEWIYLLGNELGMTMNEAFFLRSITAIVSGLLIIIYFSKPLSGILKKDSRTILIVSIMPIVYYVYDYSVTVYTDLLYNNIIIVSEFLPFIVCISYLIFCLAYFKEYEKKIEEEKMRRLLEIHSQQSIKEIEQMLKNEYEFSLIRHDMRHYLNNISVFLENKQYEEANKYLKEVTQTVSNIKLKRFCSNRIVNTVLSFYESKSLDLNIELIAKVAIPETLPCDDVKFTSILSNALENAINAVSMLADMQKNIHVLLEMNNGRLLFQVKNPCNEDITFFNELPQAKREGHGFGTQSIKNIVETLGGVCQFSVVDGFFILRVVI